MHRRVEREFLRAKSGLLKQQQPFRWVAQATGLCRAVTRRP